MGYQTITDPISRAVLHRSRLSNGVDVTLLPRPGYRKKTAVLATRFGSVDLKIPGESGSPITLPAGIAHFLEHQVFKREHGDLLADFGTYGASANAYTEHESTAYFFTTTGPFDPCLDLLADIVRNPDFRKDWVDAEQKIIEQELRMYEDQPGHRLYEQLMHAMYHVNPVRDDIGGTVESVREVTPELLQAAWESGYGPDRLMFSAAGDINPDHFFDRAESLLGDLSSRPEPLSREWSEPTQVVKERVQSEMHVSRPKVMLGWKRVRPRLTGEDLLREDAEIYLLLSLMFGRSGPLHHCLLSSGVIDDTFGWTYSSDPDWSHVLLHADAEDPDAWIEAITSAMKKVYQDGFKKRDLQRHRRKILGRYVRSFESPYSCAFYGISLSIQEKDPFTAIDAVRSITLSQIMARYEEIFNDDARTISIVTDHG